MNGRPLNCRNARLAANPATARMSGAARNRGNMRHKRYAAPAPPAMYTNCLKVRGPNILSSTSMNCGTWNCIRFSYERSELENLMSGTIVLYRRLKCACANSAFLIGRSALFPATLMPAIITHSIPLENGTMVSGRDNQPTPRVFSRRGLSIRVVFDNLPRRRGLTGYICTGSRSAFRFFLRGCRRRRCSNCRNRSGGFRSRSFNGDRSFSEHLSTRRLDIAYALFLRFGVLEISFKLLSNRLEYDPRNSRGEFSGDIFRDAHIFSYIFLKIG